MSHQPFQIPLPPGTQVGAYRIERRLGEKGGFAFTYLAVHVELNKRVALKELFPDNVVIRKKNEVVPFSNDPEKLYLWNWALRKFKEEARHLAKFRHANIVAVSDLIEANQTAYIVMQYVEGQSFDQFLRQLRRSPKESELRHIFRQILDGLEAVHQERIFHRDVKPSNIYLTREGRVILLDFGAARPENRATAAVSTVGLHSDGYSPFEQYQTNSPLTPAADIYSVSATMVRAITGQHPPSALNRTPHDPYVPLAARYARVYSQRLLRAIDAGMAIHATQRPQSIAQWRKMLEEPARVPPHERDPLIRWIYLLMACVVVGLGICVTLLALHNGAGSRGPVSVPNATPEPKRAAVSEGGTLQRLLAQAAEEQKEWERKNGSTTAPPSLLPPSPGAPPSTPRLAGPAAAPPTAPAPLVGTASLPGPVGEALTVFVKDEIEGGIQAKNYAPQVKINNTGKPSDTTTVSRNQLERDGAREREKYQTSAFFHIGGRCLNYDAATDVADVQQLFSFERVAKESSKIELGMGIRVLQIAEASKSVRCISERIVTQQVPGYRCRLSEADHRDSKGRHLFKNDPDKNHGTAVKEILLQDRLNFETKSHRDTEDMDFPPFRTTTGRAKIMQVADEVVYILPASADSLEQILEGTPVVDVFPDLDTPGLIIVIKK